MTITGEIELTKRVPKIFFGVIFAVCGLKLSWGKTTFFPLIHCVCTKHTKNLEYIIAKVIKDSHESKKILSLHVFNISFVNEILPEKKNENDLSNTLVQIRNFVQTGKL